MVLLVKKAMVSLTYNEVEPNNLISNNVFIILCLD